MVRRAMEFPTEWAIGAPEDEEPPEQQVETPEPEKTQVRTNSNQDSPQERQRQ
jgi:hypothetical protein